MSMEYTEFFHRFMASCRTKHLAQEPTLKSLVKKQLGRGKGGKPNPKKGISYRLPDASELPGNFFRLEPWEIEYLYMMGSHAKVGILETGRFRGGSTFLFACANEKVPIHSIDIAPQDDDFLKKALKDKGVGENVEIIVGDSQKTRYDSIKEIDLLFIDGDHSYQGCLNDLENWYPLVVPGGHVILHDCYFTCEVQPATIDFIANHEVELVRPPYIPVSHWRQPSGSLAHFIKRGD